MILTPDTTSSELWKGAPIHPLRGCRAPAFGGSFADTAAKEKITDLTSELRKLRHEKHLCEDIHARASDLDKRVRMVDEERGMRREVR